MKAVATVITNRVNATEGEYSRISQGGNVRNIVDNFKNKIIKEIEKLTTMRVQTIKIIIKDIHINKEENN